ncbi:MAG: pyridoxal phosphate-dependent aminotransferase [bacterium]|nr:pyridoxal phosphate-dependent aminotransferase [bacterium]
MKFSKKYHLKHFDNMVNPEQRAAYYKGNINSEAINLSTAENILLLDFYQEKAFVDLGMIEDRDIRYSTEVSGSTEYKESIARFLHKQWDVTANHDDIFIVSGVAAALECLAFSLFNDGDEVLVPAPMWYGFPWSFRQRPKMKFIPFNVSRAFELTPDDVERAVKQNPNAKLLVLTNPNNPLGVNYPRETLEEIYSFFLKDKTRHIISDEIYGCSQVKDKNEFISALNLEIYRKHPDRIHVVWGLSKDFGLSGFRVGFIVSKSQQVKDSLIGDSCYKSMAHFSPFGSLNPYMLKHLFLDREGESDPELANEAMIEYKNLLEKQYAGTAAALEKGKITYHPNNNGGIFFWIDLSEYLNRVPETVPPDSQLCPTLYDYDDIRERRLSCFIREKAGVLLIRGQASFCEEPGFFRLCYTAEKLAQVTKGIDNMARKLNELPRPANH